MTEQIGGLVIGIAALMIGLTTLLTNMRKDTQRELEAKLEKAEKDRDDYKRDLDQERQKSLEYLSSYMRVSEQLRNRRDQT